MSPAAGIHGTIVATSVVVGLSETNALSPRQALEILVAGQVAFWLAHVHASSLGERAGGRHTPLRELALDESPVLRAALPAVASICLWWAGVLEESAAYWLAVALGIAELLAIGYVAGRRTGRDRLGSVGAALLDGALGGAIAAVKALIG